MLKLKLPLQKKISGSFGNIYSRYFELGLGRSYREKISYKIEVTILTDRLFWTNFSPARSYTILTGNDYLAKAYFLLRVIKTLRKSQLLRVCFSSPWHDFKKKLSLV